MSGARGGDTASSGGRDGYWRPRSIYLVGGGVLAVAATAALILTDNPRLLKVAVIVAVWACVLALLAGVRPHAEDELSGSREEELRHTFELELDREVAARREYELRLEVALRRELENTLKKDLGELRSQVGALRKEIAERSGGELRLERFAVRAESTRLSGGDRQVLQQQAERFGLELPEHSGAAMIEQGTASFPNSPAARAARSAPSANGSSANSPGGSGLSSAPSGAGARNTSAQANGPRPNGLYAGDPPTNGASPLRDPLRDPLPPWIDRAAGAERSGSNTELPAGVTPINRAGRADAAPRDLPTGRPSLPGIRPGSELGGPPDDAAARRGGAGTNGYVRPGQPGQPGQPAQPGRRHRRAADDAAGDRIAPTGPETRRRAASAQPAPAQPLPPAPAQSVPPVQPSPAAPSPAHPVPPAAAAAASESRWTPEPSADASSQYLRETENTGERRRRRRYREDDEENDVLTRMRRQR